MARQQPFLSLLTCGLLALAGPHAAFGADDEDLDDVMEKAVKAAVKRVAPSVVQIETQGGTEVITTGPRGGLVRKGAGPTSGLIVTPDGYIASSAFNFANKPSSIIVAVPGHKERYVAKVVATDQTRMITVLKIEAGGLPVPVAAPKDNFQIGQTSLAVGRTLAANIDQSPSVSVGIVSAIHRIWGKALQTDAKVSPTNYGGPLIDLYGRVQGVLVPASPRAEGETAGIEWYDSGIGFAIPLEDVNAALPRLKQGKDLKRGMLGVTMKSTDEFGDPPVVGTIAPGSAAEKAGVKAGDTIVAIGDKPVKNHAQLLHQLGSRYEGDTVTVKLSRDGKEVVLPKVVLGGLVAAYPPAFLGLLPMRDDPAPGVEVRYVYAKSPAETAGLKAGDRIMKASRAPLPGQPAPAPTQALKGRDQLLTLVEGAPPGLEVKLEVQRKGGTKTETLTAKLIEMPDSVPDKLPEVSTARKALAKPANPMPKDKKEEKKDEEKKDEEKNVKTGLIKRTTAAADHHYYLYVPDNYDPNIAHALVLWFHPLHKNKERDIDTLTFNWANYCEDQHVIMLAPVTEGPNGWTPSDGEFIQEAVKGALDGYTIDRKRVVAHGMGVGGQMAFYLGFQNRELIRGVATTGAALGSNPKEKIANQPLAFYLVSGGRDPLKEAVKETRNKLVEHKFSAVFQEIKDRGHEYLDFDTLEELVRWIDSLDRI